MSYNFNLKRYFTIALSIFMLSGISVCCFAQQAQAEGPGGHNRAQAQSSGRTRSQGIKQTPAPQHNNYVDSRYQHNRSYPLRGESVRSLPRDYRAVTMDTPAITIPTEPGTDRIADDILVTPPFGLFVPFLPLYYTTIWIQGIPYYYANDTYYTQTDGGYL